MPRKTSLYVDQATESVVDARDFAPSKTKRHGRRSSVFREILQRYDVMCRTDVPDFPAAEWTIFVEAGRGWLESDNVSTTHRLGSLVEAASSASKPLVAKLLDLPLGQRMSVIDFVERYWSAKVRGVEIPSFPGKAAGKGARAARPTLRSNTANG